jgi:transcriptional regulator with XRE-family HTH domain
MDESIVERIISLMEYYGLSPSAFADKIDVQRSSMSHLVSGRNKPSLDFIQKILNQFIDINPTWLIMGTGPMKQLALFDDSGKVSVPEPITAVKSVSEASSFTKEPITHVQEKISHTFLNDSDTETLFAVDEIPQQTEINPPIPEDKTIPRAVVFESTEEPLTAQNPIHATRAVPANSIHTPDSKEKNTPNDKKVVKIVFFYSDNTFESFNPQ